MFRSLNVGELPINRKTPVVMNNLRMHLMTGGRPFPGLENFGQVGENAVPPGSRGE
jgi:hypothetical protein